MGILRPWIVPASIGCGCLLAALIVVIGAILGAIVSSSVVNPADVHASFLLAIAAWARAILSMPTTADGAFLERLRDRPMLPVHFVLLPSRTTGIDPYGALAAAQRCTVEAALRASPAVTLWMSGLDVEDPARALEEVRPRWQAWLRSLSSSADGDASAALGSLAVRAHRFHPSTVVGAWLTARGVLRPADPDSGHYRPARWRALGLDLRYRAAVSDLVRLDVLDRATHTVPAQIQRIPCRPCTARHSSSLPTLRVCRCSRARAGSIWTSMWSSSTRRSRGCPTAWRCRPRRCRRTHSSATCGPGPSTSSSTTP